MSVFFNPRRQFQYCSHSTVAKTVNDAANLRDFREQSTYILAWWDFHFEPVCVQVD